MKVENSTASSFAYQFIDKFVCKAIGLVVSIVLARLISPEAFGQLAILLVFINVSQMMIEGGFGSALVQAKTVDEVDYSTVLFISLGVSLALVGALWIAAPYIAAFYEADELTAPLRALSFILIVGSLGGVQNAKLQRELSFFQMMVAHLLSVLLSGVLGIYFALIGFGLWALICYYVSNFSLNVLLILILTKWIPSLRFSLASAKALFSFGWKMLASSLLCSLYSNLRSIIIGKQFSTSDLAYYDRGRQFPEIVSTTFDSVIQTVMFPLMSRAQDSLEDVSNYLGKTIKMNMLVIAPCMMLLVAMSEPLILTLFTEKWLLAIPLMKILCLAQLFTPIISPCLVAIKSIGRSDVYMRLEVVRRVAMLIVLVVSLGFGSVIAIAIGFVVSSLIDAGIVFYACGKLIPYKVGNLWVDTYKSLVSAVAVYLAAYACTCFSLESLLVLVLQLVVGAAAFLGCSLLLKNDAVMIAGGFLNALVLKIKR